MKLAHTIILSALLSLGACSGPYTPDSDSGAAAASHKPVILLDEDLTRTLAVDRQVNAQRVDGNLLKLQVGLRNRTNDETIYIQVQTLFRDGNGFVLYQDQGSPAAWETIMLTPNQTVTYSQSSLTGEAQSFTIQIRYLARQ